MITTHIGWMVYVMLKAWKALGLNDAT